MELSDLETSVKLNLIFFATKDAQTWTAIAHNKPHLDKFCENKVAEIISTLRPRVILAEGFRTFDRMKEMFKLESASKTVKAEKSNRRLVEFASNANIDLIGIIHPSGARISTADKAVIKNVLRQKFEQTASKKAA